MGRKGCEKSLKYGKSSKNDLWKTSTNENVKCEQHLIISGVLLCFLCESGCAGCVGKDNHKQKIYVKYETGRRYDPNKKYNVPKRVAIGKLCENDYGKMYLAEKFLSCFHDEEIEESDNRSKRSRCLRIGMYLVIKKLLKEFGPDKMLNQISGNDFDCFEDHSFDYSTRGKSDSRRTCWSKLNEGLSAKVVRS